MPRSPTTVLSTSITYNGLSDPSLLPPTVLQAYITYYGLFDLHHQTTVFQTPISYRQRSFRPSSPTMVLPTSINRQRRFTLPLASVKTAKINIHGEPPEKSKILLALSLMRISSLSQLFVSVSPSSADNPVSAHVPVLCFCAAI
ncbi:hypothetical protein KFK09_005861 [Dendrobium nobile]|uniref:Uncharacterized protein n=1 Tax=Dendrobium nobile TaxID=94219 RepID=A0A8T3C2J9_DENNO|nr:hypothetical protein KFK09_005861 [Dendrobium nobile]